MCVGPIHILKHKMVFKYFERFTKAERELQAARPFGYGPRKFYESSQLVKGPVEKEDKKQDTTPQPAEPVTEKVDEKEGDKQVKRIYVAMTSDRGNCFY